MCLKNVDRIVFHIRDGTLVIVEKKQILFDCPENKPANLMLLLFKTA